MSAAAQQLDLSSDIIEWYEDCKIEPGKLYANLPNELYHRGPGISKSGLDQIRRSPYHYKFMRDNPKPSTPAMMLGSALHTLVLEPEKFDQEYEQFNLTRQSKAGKEAYAQIIADGKTPISGRGDPDKGVWGASDWDKIHYMRDAVMRHPTASALLDSGIAEISGYWVDRSKEVDKIRTAFGYENMTTSDPTFRLCRLRADFYSDSHNVLVDLKSTTDASQTEFARHVNEYRYHVQDAFYREGMFRLYRPVDEFVFLAVEKEPPYAVACYTIDAAGKHLGRQLFQRDLATYSHCKETDEWPSYSQDIRELELPPYAFKVNVF